MLFFFFYLLYKDLISVLISVLNNLKLHPPPRPQLKTLKKKNDSDSILCTNMTNYTGYELQANKLLHTLKNDGTIYKACM